MDLKGEVVVNITLSSKCSKLTEDIKNYIDVKLSVLESYLSPGCEAKVIVSSKNDLQKVEVTIVPMSGPILRVEEYQDDLYMAIDIACDKLSNQLERYNKRLRSRHHNESIRFGIEYDMNEDEYREDGIIIERIKRINIKPMSPEEAILQMELIGHNFFMFRNQYTDEINVAYKRESGGYGLIEHE